MKCNTGLLTEDWNMALTYQVSIRAPCNSVNGHGRVFSHGTLFSWKVNNEAHIYIKTEHVDACKQGTTLEVKANRSKIHSELQLVLSYLKLCRTCLHVPNFERLWDQPFTQTNLPKRNFTISRSNYWAANMTRKSVRCWNSKIHPHQVNTFCTCQLCNDIFF